MPSKQQQELFQAETSWFAVLKNMIDCGDLARMGGTAFSVYCVIKAHSNYSSGTAFPGVDLIAEKAGISTPQVNRCLNKLIEMDYISKEKRGRSNIYRLREKVGLHDSTGQEVAQASWDYVPSGLKEALTEVKNVLLTGDFGGAKIISINRLNVNIANGDNITQVNFGDIVDKDLRDSLLNLYNSHVSKSKQQA